MSALPDDRIDYFTAGPEAAAAIERAAAAAYALSAVPECDDEGIVRPCPACARERERVAAAFDAGQAGALAARQAAFRAGAAAAVGVASTLPPACSRFGSVGATVLVVELGTTDFTRHPEYPRE